MILLFCSFCYSLSNHCPKKIVGRGTRLVMVKESERHWKYISLFESHDYVDRWYRKAHGGNASSTKIGQINACFAHGREYFRNAERSDMSVKPLLLYYGVLSYSRGVILANNSSKKEESLKPRHGIETVDWQNTLSGGIKNVLDLGVRATDGTFGELVDVCWHLKTRHLFAGATNELVSAGQRLGDVAFASDGSMLTLDDLIARLLQTGLGYADLTGRPPKTFRGARIASHPPGIHLAFPLVGIPDQLRGLADGQTVTIGSSNQVCPGFRQSDDAGDTLIFHGGRETSVDPVFPVSHYGGEGEYMVVIADFPNGDRLTEFIKLYLVAFVLGMLGRYYPSVWTALLRNEKGDFAQPLLVQAVEAVQEAFAEQLSHQLTGVIK